jgi:serine phosphatase RsbU (regulator of sigma subunit)
VSHAAYGECAVELGIGDSLLLYTDGVTEARRDARLFGEGRVRRVLRRSPSARACVDALLGAVKAYAVGPLRDDAAALVVRRLG